MEGFWHAVGQWARENLTDFTITKIYLACAVAGGTVLIGQTGLNLFGMGHDGDVDPDTDVDDIEGGDHLNFLSIRALASFLTFFGLVGWGGVASGWSTPAHVLAALSSGIVVMLVVALIMRFFKRMASEGTVHAENAIGSTAQVYLRIPGGRSGKGKITVSIQGRSMEFEAVTAGPELPTGSGCRIERLVTSDTFEVVALD